MIQGAQCIRDDFHRVANKINTSFVVELEARLKLGKYEKSNLSVREARK